MWLWHGLSLRELRINMKVYSLFFFQKLQPERTDKQTWNKQTKPEIIIVNIMVR